MGSVAAEAAARRARRGDPWSRPLPNRAARPSSLRLDGLIEYPSPSTPVQHFLDATLAPPDVVNYGGSLRRYLGMIREV